MEKATVKKIKRSSTACECASKVPSPEPMTNVVGIEGNFCGKCMQVLSWKFTNGKADDNGPIKNEKKFKVMSADDFVEKGKPEEVTPDNSVSIEEIEPLPKALQDLNKVLEPLKTLVPDITDGVIDRGKLAENMSDAILSGIADKPLVDQKFTTGHNPNLPPVDPNRIVKTAKPDKKAVEKEQLNDTDFGKPIRYGAFEAISIREAFKAPDKLVVTLRGPHTDFQVDVQSSVDKVQANLQNTSRIVGKFATIRWVDEDKQFNPYAAKMLTVKTQEELNNQN